MLQTLLVLRPAASHARPSARRLPAPPRSAPPSIASIASQAHSSPTSHGDDDPAALRAALELWGRGMAPENIAQWQRDQMLMYQALMGLSRLPSPPGIRQDHDHVAVEKGDTEDLLSSPSPSTAPVPADQHPECQMVTSSDAQVDQSASTAGQETQGEEHPARLADGGSGWCAHGRPTEAAQQSGRNSQLELPGSAGRTARSLAGTGGGVEATAVRGPHTSRSRIRCRLGRASGRWADSTWGAGRWPVEKPSPQTLRKSPRRSPQC